MSKYENGKREMMRTPKEILELILNVAKADDNIIAVMLTGSRTNTMLT